MPKVGKKHFSYSAKGKAAAKRYAKKTGKKMRSYDRSEFLKLCEETIEDYTQAMRKTAKRVGLSCDYDNEYLTDSPDYRAVSQSIFVDLFLENPNDVLINLVKAIPDLIE